MTTGAKWPRGLSWCIIPVRWFQAWVIPPKGERDWQLVSFQPMLYLATWIATIIILTLGDFRTDDHTGAFRDESASTIWIWASLGLIAPVLGFIALRMISHHRGRWRLRGLWLRLCADIGQLTAMTLYTIMRMIVGDFHIYPVACMMAGLLFVFHLNLRDIKRLREVENLAEQIYLGEVD